MTIVAASHHAVPTGFAGSADAREAMAWGGAPLLALSVAAMVWALEHHRRGQLADGGAELRAPSLLSCGRAMLRLAPEIAGLVVTALIIGAVLTRGENNGAPLTTKEDHELWKEIQADWPSLATADSLIALAAFLRLVLFLSAELHREEAEASPLMAEPMMFSFLAAACRSALLLASPEDVYRLDGPLGGPANVVAEVAAVPIGLHLVLAGGVTRRCSRAAVVAGIAFVVPIAVCNRLAIADAHDAHLDVLFSLGHLLELCAAVAFLVRTLLLDSHRGGPFSTLAYLLLPLQQLLPAYFLLTAWGGKPLQPVTELVGAGHPFEVLQLAGLAQVGLYVLSAALRLGFCLEEKAADSYIAV